MCPTNERLWDGHVTRGAPSFDDILLRAALRHWVFGTGSVRKGSPATGTARSNREKLSAVAPTMGVMRKRNHAQQPLALITLLPPSARRRTHHRRRWDPPDTLYFVSCGSDRPDEAHLYRQQGWARNRLKIASKRTQQARCQHIRSRVSPVAERRILADPQGGSSDQRRGEGSIGWTRVYGTLMPKRAPFGRT